MINFRVRDLDAIVRQLRAAEVDVTLDPERYPNGRFARLQDPEGNPVELWEPKDAAALDAVGPLDHVELFVPDRDEAARWYQRVLGLAVIEPYRHWAENPQGPLMISSDDGRTKLALFTGRPQGAQPTAGFHRVAFRFPPSIVGWSRPNAPAVCGPICASSWNATWQLGLTGRPK